MKLTGLMTLLGGLALLHCGQHTGEIARKLGVSRQTAQRLVSLSVTEKLIKVRLDHPIGHCLELSDRLKGHYGIDFCEVVPSDPESNSSTLGVPEAAAAELERYLAASGHCGNGHPTDAQSHGRATDANGRLINGLITNERMAELLLD